MPGGVIEQILNSRGLGDKAKREAFLAPDYEAEKHDPFLLPDMDKAVARLLAAKKAGETVWIYGDYDIDGLTATTLLLDALASFGIKTEAFIPNRFTDGYGLSAAAIKQLAECGATLIVTVDCGSLSHKEIALAGELGVDVIVTDHHSVADTMPPAVAVVNPKREGHKYPFIDLAGVGVAFKLVQALQSRTEGLPAGREKWLLDLVALGTVCDVVQLTGENRANVFWGLKVMTKGHRPGILALMQVAGLSPDKLGARALGYILGPHLNAAGRLETAELSLELLTATDKLRAVEIAYQLRDLNLARRAEQQRITAAALEAAAAFNDDPVLVLSDASWSQGVVGIVAAKVLEALHKPAFIMQELGEQTKGSARSFGDFSAVEAIKAAEKLLLKGGGHKLAAGVTLKTADIAAFRQAVNDFYRQADLKDQLKHFEPRPDAIVNDLTELNHELMTVIKSLEPYGHGNPEPTLHIERAVIQRRRNLGADGSHLKLEIGDRAGHRLELIGFRMAKNHPEDVGDEISVWFKLVENEWNGQVKLEGQLIQLSRSPDTAHQ